MSQMQATFPEYVGTGKCNRLVKRKAPNVLSSMAAYFLSSRTRMQSLYNPPDASCSNVETPTTCSGGMPGAPTFLRRGLSPLPVIHLTLHTLLAETIQT